MAHFVRHQQPNWHFVRCESFNDKCRREVAEKQLAEIEKARVKTSGMWYNDQRYVDQVAPSQTVHPDHLDTFNYRYQVYARPFRAPKSLAEVIHKKGPKLYDVKRLAADKMWTPSDPVCADHWSKHPWQVSCCPQIGSEETEQSNNNNNLIVQKSSGEICDDLHRFQSSGESCDDLHRFQSSGETCDDLHRFQSSGETCDDLHRFQSSGETCDDLHRFQSSGETCDDLHRFQSSGETCDDLHRFQGETCDDLHRFQSSGETCDDLHRFQSLGETCDDLHHFRDTCVCRRKANGRRENALPMFTNKSQDIEAAGNGGHVMSSDQRIYLSKCPIEADLKCAFAKNVANRKKHWKDTLLGNENSNINVKLMKESEVIFIDNLKGITQEDVSDVDTPWVIVPRISHINESISCRNNNAEDYQRPTCIPGLYRDSVHLSRTPNQNGEPPLKRKYEHRTTPCMEILGHLENHVKPTCFLRDQLEQHQSDCVSEERQKGNVDLEKSEIGYLTYKIVGGRQYCEPPPIDYLSMVKLPQHLQEYREFTRRCPNPTVGRYDRADPANEMLLPRHKASNTMSVSRKPFVYLRNPRSNQFPPLYYQPKVTDDLYWRLPSAALASLKD